jgi:very-short-patch-repair endonuclease
MPSPSGCEAGETPTVVVASIATRQHALVTYAQASDAGFSANAIRHRVDVGVWRTVLPRVYGVNGAPATARQAAMAAALWAGDGALCSHLTAATLWGFEGVTTSRVEVTIPYERALRHRRVVVHRSQSLPETDRARRDGIPVTSAARTLVDIAGVLSPERLEVALEHALRERLTTVPALAARLDELGGKGRRGAGVLRELLAERGSQASPLESPLEVRLWRLFVRAGLPRPVRQHAVVAGGRSFRLDFAWPQELVAVEADGYRAHGGRAAFVRDRRRAGVLTAAGWSLLHVTWEQVTSEPELVAATVRDALRIASLKRHSRRATLGLH